MMLTYSLCEGITSRNPRCFKPTGWIGNALLPGKRSKPGRCSYGVKTKLAGRQLQTQVLGLQWSQIDAERSGNLSSAIRLFVLASCRNGELGGVIDMIAAPMRGPEL